jgi:hypothetical protein
MLFFLLIFELGVMKVCGGIGVETIVRQPTVERAGGNLETEESTNNMRTSSSTARCFSTGDRCLWLTWVDNELDPSPHPDLVDILIYAQSSKQEWIRRKNK